MPLESTVICVDNSEFMRNGDYIPNRLQAQQDAVNTVCRSKLLANPENNVGLLTFANTEVLATLTTDAGRILTSLHKVQPNGFINFVTGIRIAHLSLKHRQSKNHKMRIVAFIGSPIGLDEKEVTKLAKRLKKENVSVDIINFGETDQNQVLLEAFVNTLNGREGTGSHLVTIPPSPHLSDALLSSPIIQGEDGSGPSNFSSGGGFDFGVDPNEDPELALALRVSMEEQRQRQQEEEKRTNQPAEGAMEGVTTAADDAAAPEGGAAQKATEGGSAAAPAKKSETGGPNEEEMLQQALAMSMESGAGLEAAAKENKGAAASAKPAPKKSAEFPDFSTMTEEEQIAYAMQISLQGCQSREEPMDVDEPSDKKEKTGSSSGAKSDPDYSEVMSDPAFLEDVLQSLPGVDPQSKVVRQAVGSLVGQDKKDKKDEKKKKDEDSKK